MPAITEDHLIESIADALQYISYYHPADFVQAMTAAWEREENKGAKDAMAQILVNSRMCAVGHRPICQDTGAANIHIKVGVEAPLALKRSLQEIVDEAVRRKAFARGFKRDVDAGESLGAEIDMLMEKDALAALSMARKAGPRTASCRVALARQRSACR